MKSNPINDPIQVLDKPEGVELRDIPGYERLYAIARDGRVWSYPKTWIGAHGCKNIHNGKWLKIRYTNKNATVMLCKNGIPEDKAISRLVAQMYLPQQKQKKYLCHIDRNIKNNCVDNLIWSDNNLIFRSYLESKKQIDKFTINCKLLRRYKSIVDASIDTGINRTNISRNVSGNRKTAGGFIWKYADDK